MYDLLVFNTFIAKDVLLVINYAGVLFVPLVVGYLYYKGAFAKVLPEWSSANRFWAIMLLMILFLLMQIMWRVMFEVLIGYFDMHDYLHELLLER